MKQSEILLKHRPCTGRSSGSGGAVVAPPVQPMRIQAETPPTQSEGEGSLIPKRTPIMHFTGIPTPAVPTTSVERPPLTAAEQYQLLGDRVMSESTQIAVMQQRMSNVEEIFTAEDMNDLNTLQQSAIECKKAMACLKSQSTAEPVAIPRTQVLQSEIFRPQESRPREGSRHHDKEDQFVWKGVGPYGRAIKEDAQIKVSVG